ncbi:MULTISPECIES: sugar O-acetyltransferase [Enterococcus]|uniref:Acetyltransferase n=1 Tax=Candidatus Enterococcus ferrettii TaxID=2815324 RepID=A0ABV0EX00_9ENTE|nr:sugar O-acetyltransferase [Enterococcus sp. 665A]MBO1339549.1 sugar O-acetyltransferase [Enterococcus sp. 665A]
MNIETVKKMINSGEPYDDMDAGVEAIRAKAIQECRRYNFLVNSENKYDLSILQGLLHSIGEDVYIESNFLCEFGFNISIGSNVYINHDLIILDCNQVTIGNGVYIAPRVGMYGANHAEDPIERAEDHIVYSKPIKIGDRVWLGAGVHVLQGVTVGENTIIGAGSVVTKDIPANVIAAGNPCKVIRPIRESDRKNGNKF